jgi:hypothetical protein
MRVVFDTNALSNNSFDLLEASPMRDLVRRGRIKPVYGHVFIEETMRTYGSDKRRADLVARRLPFLADTAALICNDFLDIWQSELIQSRGIHARIFMQSKTRARLVAAWRNVPADGSWRAWNESADARQEEDRKRAVQKDISRGIRDEIVAWKREVSYAPSRHGISELQRYIAENLVFAGKLFIATLVKSKNPTEVANRWSRGPDAYPFFTTFVKNMLYIAHHAATRPDAIDLNAQADLDVMTHLIHAEVLVSNETRFMRTAFEDLWRPRKKVLFTASEFAMFLTKL